MILSKNDSVKITRIPGFAAEPVYAKTGKGHLKSVGVSELLELKQARKLPTEEHGR